jgi:hypothetical protein
MSASINDDATGPPDVEDIECRLTPSAEANPEQTNCEPHRLDGALDASTGARQMLLSLLGPENARYAASEFGNIDACVQHAVAGWPLAAPEFERSALQD